MNNKTLSIILIIILAGILFVFLVFRPDAPVETDPMIDENTETLDPAPNAEDAPGGANTDPSPSTAGTVLTARLNQAVSFAGGTGRIIEVLEDSRCPLDVQCIQAGTVRVKVNFTYGALSQNVNLTLNQPYIYSGKSITLTNVSPAPRSTETILPGDYKFTLLVK
jgi:hypothetical protein